MPFSDMGLDEVDVALFLLRLEDEYQIQFSFLLPLQSLKDVCVQIESYPGKAGRFVQKRNRREIRNRSFRG